MLKNISFVSFKGTDECKLKEQEDGNVEHNCETCKWGEWYRRGYDITMMDDECGGCCSWNDKWKSSEVIEDGKID